MTNFISSVTKDEVDFYATILLRWLQHNRPYVFFLPEKILITQKQLYFLTTFYNLIPALDWHISYQYILSPLLGFIPQKPTPFIE